MYMTLEKNNPTTYLGYKQVINPGHGNYIMK